MSRRIGRCKVRAHANIALSKYWGKSDLALNLPALPSALFVGQKITIAADRCASSTRWTMSMW